MGNKSENLFYIFLGFAIPLLFCYIPIFLVYGRFVRFTAHLFLFVGSVLLIPVCLVLAVGLVIIACNAAYQLLRKRNEKDKSIIKYYKYIVVFTTILFSSALLAQNLSPAIPRERELQAIVDRIHAGEGISFDERYRLGVRYAGVPGYQYVRFPGFAGWDYLYYDHAFYLGRSRRSPEGIGFVEMRVIRYRHIYGNWYYALIDLPL